MACWWNPLIWTRRPLPRFLSNTCAHVGGRNTICAKRCLHSKQELFFQMNTGGVSCQGQVASNTTPSIWEHRIISISGTLSFWKYQKILWNAKNPPSKMVTYYWMYLAWREGGGLQTHPSTIPWSFSTIPTGEDVFFLRLPPRLHSCFPCPVTVTGCDLLSSQVSLSSDDGGLLSLAAPLAHLLPTQCEGQNPSPLLLKRFPNSCLHISCQCRWLP